MATLLDFLPEKQIQFSANYLEVLNNLKEVYKKLYQPDFELDIDLYQKIISMVQELWKMEAYVPPCITTDILDKLTEKNSHFFKELSEMVMNEYLEYRYYHGKKELYVKCESAHTHPWARFYAFKEHMDMDLVSLGNRYFKCCLEQLKQINEKLQWIGVKISNRELFSMLEIMNLPKFLQKKIMERFDSFCKDMKRLVCSESIYVLSPISFYSFWISQKKDIYFADSAQELQEQLSLFYYSQQQIDILFLRNQVLTHILEDTISSFYDNMYSLFETFQQDSRNRTDYLELQQIEMKKRELQNRVREMRAIQNRETNCTRISFLGGLYTNYESHSSLTCYSQEQSSCLEQLQDLKRKSNDLKQRKDVGEKFLPKMSKNFDFSYPSSQFFVSQNSAPVIFAIQNQTVLFNCAFGFEMSEDYFLQKGLTLEIQKDVSKQKLARILVEPKKE